jgi:hypothetical protein
MRAPVITPRCAHKKEFRALYGLNNKQRSAHQGYKSDIAILLCRDNRLIFAPEPASCERERGAAKERFLSLLFTE